ncbi:hypothetical protein FJQ98_25890 [Lysinibacillus agricola]|uniref:Uncharacterized protein n=1 Tax=Lysinibacillus agricola TaxID=2590012 RepID=A0ABX7ARK9_9BACI|nr:hypothetical protein [Lysinibacillus agricola]QQP12459.1 hypothetical protein FJQ98_25890 [Lysinibacillus agricola]
MLKRIPCILVDWSGNWATPSGSVAHRTPPGSFALRESEQCFICAKAKRQRQSAQSERKSTTRYGDDPKNGPPLRSFIVKKYSSILIYI